MAELNFGLLTPPGSQSIGNAFVSGMDQGQESRARDLQMQQSVRKGQMDELQFRKAQEAEAKLNQFYAHVADNGGPKDPVAIEDAMIKSGVPNVADSGLAARMARLKIEQSRVQAREAMGLPSAGVAVSPVAPVAPTSPFGADMAANRAELPSFVGGNQLAAAAGALPVAAPTNAMIPPDKQAAINSAKQKMLSDNPGVRDAGKMELEQLTKPGVQHVVGDKLIGADGRVIYEGAFKPAPPPSMVAEYTFAKTPDGGGFRGSFQDFVIARSAAARPPAQPRPEQPAQPVIDPDNPDKIILVSREEAIRRRMTPANAVEKPMTQAQRVKYGKDKVSDKNVVNGAFAVTGELEKLTDELVGNPDKKIAPAPGLNSITGYSALTNPIALPSGDARKALQKLDTFKGKIMALGRQLAAQEGKLGNMAVQEWKFVSDAVQKIDPAAGNLDAQMRDVVRQAKEYALRQQSKYDDTYADDLTAPPAGAPGKWGKAVAE
jgi:hypothetical protein